MFLTTWELRQNNRSKETTRNPENCTALLETKVNQGVWNNLDESAGYTDLKFQEVQKSLIKE